MKKLFMTPTGLLLATSTEQAHVAGFGSVTFLVGLRPVLDASMGTVVLARVRAVASESRPATKGEALTELMAALFGAGVDAPVEDLPALAAPAGEEDPA